MGIPLRPGPARQAPNPEPANPHILNAPRIDCDERLSLRPVRLEDAEAVYRIVDAQRDHLGQWLPWVAHTQSIVPLRQFIRESMRFNSGGQRLTWFIWFDDQIVGSVSIVGIDHANGAGEIGYWLSRDHQGQGIMTRAVAAVMRHAFQHLQLNRLVIKAPVNNRRSCAVAERLGFRREGVLRQALQLHGQWHDLALYSMLRQEWEEKTGGN